MKKRESARTLLQKAGVLGQTVPARVMPKRAVRLGRKSPIGVSEVLQPPVQLGPDVVLLGVEEKPKNGARHIHVIHIDDMLEALGIDPDEEGEVTPAQLTAADPTGVRGWRPTIQRWAIEGRLSDSRS